MHTRSKYPNRRVFYTHLPVEHKVHQLHHNSDQAKSNLEIPIQVAPDSKKRKGASSIKPVVRYVVISMLKLIKNHCAEYF